MRWEGVDWCVGGGGSTIGVYLVQYILRNIPPLGWAVAFRLFDATLAASRDAATAGKSSDKSAALLAEIRVPYLGVAVETIFDARRRAIIVVTMRNNCTWNQQKETHPSVREDPAPQKSRTLQRQPELWHELRNTPLDAS
ncbi:hypothetical protein Sjap_002991 [Stephania japonica]|uniref:Uncharacterized protein n=1 Tax=Stephania japonica TaxID=461633 RepID=A0AAP0KMW5_9MAGN